MLLVEETVEKTVRPVPSRRTFGDILTKLGNVAPDRVRFDPLPATEEQALWVHEHECSCEWIDGIIVEVPVGSRQDFFASSLVYLLCSHVIPRMLGPVLVPRTLFRMANGGFREPDLSFTIQARVVKPIGAICEWCPDLCIEVLSDGNEPEEMLAKRRDYFESGCRLVWEFEPNADYVDVYTDPETFRRLTSADTLDGGEVLPEFQLPLQTLFSDFHQSAE